MIGPPKPVSWALAFAVHTLATFIFEVQGSNTTVQNITDEAESSFHWYFEQLSIASEVMNDGSQTKKRLLILKMLVSPRTLETQLGTNASCFLDSIRC